MDVGVDPSVCFPSDVRKEVAEMLTLEQDSTYPFSRSALLNTIISRLQSLQDVQQVISCARVLLRVRVRRLTFRQPHDAYSRFVRPLLKSDTSDSE
jgi:hypothetical protein